MKKNNTITIKAGNETLTIDFDKRLTMVERATVIERAIRDCFVDKEFVYGMQTPSWAINIVLAHVQGLSKELESKIDLELLWSEINRANLVSLISARSCNDVEKMYLDFKESIAYQTTGLPLSSLLSKIDGLLDVVGSLSQSVQGVSDDIIGKDNKNISGTIGELLSLLIKAKAVDQPDVVGVVKELRSKKK